MTFNLLKWKNARMFFALKTQTHMKNHNPRLESKSINGPQRHTNMQFAATKRLN